VFVLDDKTGTKAPQVFFDYLNYKIEKVKGAEQFEVPREKLKDMEILSNEKIPQNDLVDYAVIFAKVKS